MLAIGQKLESFLFTVEKFGKATPRLVNSKPYEQKIRHLLDAHGNKAAWDMCRRYAYAMLEYGRQHEDDEEARERSRAAWQTYVLRFSLRFPNKKIAA